MVARNTHRLVPAVGFFLCLLSIIPLAQGRDTCKGFIVPKPVAHALSHAVPEWEVIDLSQLSEKHQDLWRKRHSQVCPGIAEGKFTPKAMKSFAVLLSKQQDGEPYLQVVLLTPAVRGYDMLQVTPPSGAEGDNVLTTAQPGRYRGVDGKTVDIRLNGIILEQLESGSVLFYWRNEKFHSLILSE